MVPREGSPGWKEFPCSWQTTHTSAPKGGSGGRSSGECQWFEKLSHPSQHLQAQLESSFLSIEKTNSVVGDTHFQLVPEIKPEETRERLWDDWLPARFSISLGPFSSSPNLPASPLLHRDGGALLVPHVSWDFNPKQGGIALPGKTDRSNGIPSCSTATSSYNNSDPSQYVISWWKAEGGMSPMRRFELPHTDVQVAHWAAP